MQSKINGLKKNMNKDISEPDIFIFACEECHNMHDLDFNNRDFPRVRKTCAICDFHGSVKEIAEKKDR